MPNRTDDLDINEIVEQLTGPSNKLLEEFRADKKRRILSDRLAAKADKLIISETKRNRRQSTRKPAGLTRRLAGRVGGAAMGGIGNAFGAIPVVGAMFRAIGQETAGLVKDNKAYNKELRKQREIELKLIQQHEAMTKKQEELKLADEEKQRKIESKAAERLQREEERRQKAAERASRDYEQTSAVQKLNLAADSLQASLVSIVPAVQAFGEGIEKLQASGGAGASRISDPQVIEYLHAAEYFAQETAAGVERLVHSHGGSVGKDIGNIKWHMARANGTVGRIEKLLQSADKVSGSGDLGNIEKDIGNIKWHMARANGSTGRIEKMLKQAAFDRLEMLNKQEEMVKLEKDQVANQEDQKLIGILGMLTNMIGGGGLMKAIGGIGGALGKAGVAGVAIVGAWEVGQAIGKELNEWLSTKSGFQDAMNSIFTAMDHVLSFFGDDEAKRRIDVQGQMDDIARAKQLREMVGGTLSSKDELYVMQNGTLPGMDRETFMNDGFAGFDKYNERDYRMLLQRNYQDQATAMDAEAFNKHSAQMDALRNGSSSTNAAVVNSQSNTTNNSNTVMPAPLSAEPTTRDRSRNLGR